MPAKVLPHHLLRYHKLPLMLRQWRLHAKISTLTLARRMHVARQVVLDIETGNHPISLIEFLEWCAGCHVQPEMAIFEIRVSATNHYPHILPLGTPDLKIRPKRPRPHQTKRHKKRI